MSRPASRLDILVVENDPAMVRLMKEAFKEAGMIGRGTISH